MHAVGLFLAMGLCASCDEPGLLPVHPPPLPTADAAPRTRFPDDLDDPPERGASVDAAWAAAIGQPARAKTTTDAALAAIGGGPMTPFRQYARRDRYALVDARQSILVMGRRQLIIFDASSLAPRAALRAPELIEIHSVPNSALFVALNTAGHSVLYDARSLALVHDFGGADVVVSPDGASIGVLEKPNVFWLFDVARRGERWRTVGNVALEELTFADDGRVVVARDTAGSRFTSETRTARRLTTGSVRDVPPAFSPDGRMIAHEVVTDQGDTVLQLTERATGKVVARSSACAERSAMTFDAAGRRLAIGGALHVCILHVPSLRLEGQATLGVVSGDATEFDRVTPNFVSEGRMVFAGRRDGRAALLDASTMKLLWTGRGRLVRIGERAFVDAGSAFVGDIGPSGAVTMRKASVDELVQVHTTNSGTALRPDAATVRRLEGRLCTVDGWLLPLSCP